MLALLPASTAGREESSWAWRMGFWKLSVQSWSKGPASSPVNPFCGRPPQSRKKKRDLGNSVSLWDSDGRHLGGYIVQFPQIKCWGEAAYCLRILTPQNKY